MYRINEVLFIDSNNPIIWNIAKHRESETYSLMK